MVATIHDVDWSILNLKSQANRSVCIFTAALVVRKSG